MARIITFTPLQSPTRIHVTGPGRLLSHRCEDVTGRQHQQRLPLGSVQGIMYLDALCLHCGSHFVWVEEPEPEPVSSGRLPTGGRPKFSKKSANCT